MPNHVTNILSFSGDEASIKELLKLVKGDKWDFEFDKFHPMPKSLKDTTSPVKIVSDDEMNEWERKKREKKLTDYEEKTKPMTKRRSDYLIKKYGVNNWYDWALMNWGTKCGAYEVSKLGDNSFYFLTAWATPVEAMMVLSKTFPNVEIFVRYYDEDFGCNTGEYSLLNGAFTKIYKPKDCSEEAYRLAIDIDGSDAYYTDDLLDIDEDEDITDVYTATCIKLAYENDVDCDDFPKIVLNKLMEIAVEKENYEKAGAIKKIIDKNFKQ